MFQMSRRGGGGRGRKEKKKDVWDVEGGYMGMKKQKLEEQFKEQVCSTFTVFILMIFSLPGRSRGAGRWDLCRSCNLRQRAHRSIC